jgi:signal transduction histidine kinase
MKLINPDILPVALCIAVSCAVCYILFNFFRKKYQGQKFIFPYDSGVLIPQLSFTGIQSDHDLLDERLMPDAPGFSKPRMKAKGDEEKNITEAILHAQEKERNDIGAELHDNVNQILVGTNLLLSMIRTEPARAVDYIDECIENVELAIAESRRIAHRLVAPDPDAETLIQQIERLSNNMLQKAGLKTIVLAGRFSEDLLTKDQKLTIYRVLQEQCTNIIKHADAKTVAILLDTDNSQARVRIVDDGKGVHKSFSAEGIGLRNITGRLKILDGQVKVDTDSGDGFMLQISFPLD